MTDLSNADLIVTNILDNTQIPLLTLDYLKELTVIE